ncbi:hypothetical protein HK105_202748 [Polyrhizophydium stewartii]|uniref:DUF2007 domain-containing protein n=1 Tax=Polyrhizophydium stewartii TaxID=2732419 RepID=A0ABR4NEC4_9FUNG
MSLERQIASAGFVYQFADDDLLRGPALIDMLRQPMGEASCQHAVGGGQLIRWQPSVEEAVARLQRSSAAAAAAAPAQSLDMDEDEVAVADDGDGFADDSRMQLE